MVLDKSTTAISNLVSSFFMIIPDENDSKQHRKPRSLRLSEDVYMRLKLLSIEFQTNPSDIVESVLKQHLPEMYIESAG